MIDTDYRQLSWRDVAEGDTIPSVHLDITVRRLFVNAAGAWDTFPGHYDRDYARANGHPDVFANTSLLLAFADRVIDKTFTSQLTVLTDDEFGAGVQRIREADAAAGGELQLLADFHLFATIGWV